MKKISFFLQQLVLIIFLLLLFSCQSKNNNLTAKKKYSEYNDLEKLNLKGNVVMLKDVDNRVYLFNEKGMIEKSYSDEADSKEWTLYNYTNNLLTNRLIYSKTDLPVSGFARHNFFYDSNSYLISESYLYIINNEEMSMLKKYYNDENGFKIKETAWIIDDNNTKNYDAYFWRNGELDSSYAFDDNNYLFFKRYYKGGVPVKYVSYNKKKEIEPEYTSTLKYVLDINGNYTKSYRNNLNGDIDSSTRTILYKGADLQPYYNKFSYLFINLSLVNGKMEINNYENDNSNNFITPQVQQKQWINCRACHGTGLNICSECGGKGIRECPNCHGRGFYWDAQHSSCNYCGGHGQVQCNQCYGKGNRGSCSSCGGRGQVQE